MSGSAKWVREGQRAGQDGTGQGMEGQRQRLDNIQGRLSPPTVLSSTSY